MRTRSIIIISSLLILLLWVAITLIAQKPIAKDDTITLVNHAEDHGNLKDSIHIRAVAKNDPTNPMAVMIDDDTWLPEGWTGLPLSKDNKLFVDPTTLEFSKAFDKFYFKLRTLKNNQWNPDGDSFWEELVANFAPKIGWNGIFDAVDRAQKETGKEYSTRLHTLGELLFTFAEKPRHAVEITSRDMLHKAPLHGSVWTTIQNMNVNDTDALFSVVDEDLCYFKKYPTMGNIWISCAHGVGHGLANLFGVDRIGEGLEICSRHPDEQFQYACATGIYMALDPEYGLLTFAPCDTNRFAPACFRFKYALASRIFYNTTDPCVTQSSPYHRRACIWGFSYISQIGNPLEAFHVCAPFRPPTPNHPVKAGDYAACFDGFWGTHDIHLLPESFRGPTFCDPLKDYDRAHKVCEYYLKNTLTTFSFNEESDEEMVYYNYDLLEELFTPAVLGKPAGFLPEWLEIKPKPPQQSHHMKANNEHNHH